MASVCPPGGRGSVGIDLPGVTSENSGREDPSFFRINLVALIYCLVDDGPCDFGSSFHDDPALRPQIALCRPATKQGSPVTGEKVLTRP